MDFMLEEDRQLLAGAVLTWGEEDWSPTINND